MNRFHIINLTLWLVVTISTVAGHNITNILSDFPEYSVFNDYLTKTRLADEINSRETITVLVLNNSVVTKFVANQSLSVVKPALSIHVLLDYFDMGKLLTIGRNMTTTTLYQTTGTANGNTGFVNITDLNDGKVAFESAAPGFNITSLYTKTVIELPYDISVLEISSPIIALEIIPVPSDVNISNLLDAHRCWTFLKLLKNTGVLKIYQRVAERALTVFAPTDVAFQVAGLPDLDKLTTVELVSLLLFHATPSYVPEVTLNNVNGPMPTLATNSVGEFALTVQNDGGSLMLNTGVHGSRVINIVIDSVPVSIFTVANVLLPRELFNAPPAGATEPTLAPKSLPPSVSAQASGSTPIASSPGPVTISSPEIPPPAPPTSAPAGGVAPADSSTADMGNNNAGSVDKIKAPVIFLVPVIISILF